MNLFATPAFVSFLAAADGIPPLLVPIIYGGIVLALLGICVAIVAIRSDARIERSRHETIRAALEKGVALPPDLLKGRRASQPHDDRRAAIILLVLSPGLFVFLRMLGLGAVAYVSVITACIGLALLLNWMLDRKAAPPETADDRP